MPWTHITTVNLQSKLCEPPIHLLRKSLFRWMSKLSTPRLMAMDGPKWMTLHATLKGVPAHKSVIDEWLALRSKVEPQATDLPPAGRLSDALKSLLLPPCSFPGFERECLLPVFTPRVEPVTTSRDEVTWCYSVSMADEHALTWRIRARGDGLWVSLDRRGEALAEFHLDFALCREALTHLAEGRTPQPAAGFSELGMNVSPRLERIRASILGHGANARLTQFPVVVRSSARRIEIG